MSKAKYVDFENIIDYMLYLQKLELKWNELLHEEQSSENKINAKTWDSWKHFMFCAGYQVDRAEMMQEQENYLKTIQKILDELIATEVTYVNNLWNGLTLYGDICKREDAPVHLRDKNFQLFGNLQQIAIFHRDEFLPMLQRFQSNPKDLFVELKKYFHDNDDSFYSYVTYTMNQRRSLRLCDIHRDYLNRIRNELDDKMGINSFLLQPIHRLPRYQLLFQQFSKKVDGSKIFEYDHMMKILKKEHEAPDELRMMFRNRQIVKIGSDCLEKRVKNLLRIINESESINDIVGVELLKYQGKFRKVSEFNVFDPVLKRKYRSKVFLFEKNVIYTKIKGNQLFLQGFYPCEDIQINLISDVGCFTFLHTSPDELQFSSLPFLGVFWKLLLDSQDHTHIEMSAQECDIFSSN